MSQELQLNLFKGGSRLFAGNIYCYGLKEGKQTTFCIYKFNLKLQALDSFKIALPKSTPENYLQPSSDTLHSYLNIYLQQKDKEQVTVHRFNKKFELIATVPDVNIARLNNTELFSEEALYYKTCVYSINVQSDTSGKQFYLNKYTLKSDTRNFDYAFTWQFPFERKEVSSAHIFFADQRFVYMLVDVAGGKKEGQWILKVNAGTGKLARGTRLNAKSEKNTYLFGSCLSDSSTGIIQLLGEKLSEAQFSKKDNRLNIANRTVATVYMLDIDSTGDIIARQDLKVPMTIASSGAKKVNNNCFLKIAAFTKDKEGGLSFETDLYGNTDNSLCYRYMNTALFRIMMGEEVPVLEKNTLTSNSLIEKFYFTNDKLDMNGRLCTDSISHFAKLAYSTPVLPVKIDFKSSNTISSWLLVRSNVKKHTINYTILQPQQKNYGLTLLDEVSKEANPQLTPLSDQSVLISKQLGSNSYQLKLFGW